MPPIRPLRDAFLAHTVNAAFQISHDRDLGSIEVGKSADFVELSADPFTVDAHRLTDAVRVQGTWRGGRRIDLDAFLEHVEAIDSKAYAALAEKAAGRHVCSHGGQGCEHEGIETTATGRGYPQVPAWTLPPPQFASRHKDGLLPASGRVMSI
jgi:urease alpha subunit